MLALIAVMSGADGWIAVEHFCVSQREWFERFLRLRNGIPTHDTFERVFAALCPKWLQRCLSEWLTGAGMVKDDEVIAIDGKTLRGRLCRAAESSALHVLHAFGTGSGVLGQEAVDSKENEITTVPRILSQLADLRGRTVAMDAMGCQQSVAADVTTREGKYVLALKDNHKTLRKHVVQRFAFAERIVPVVRLSLSYYML